MKPDDLSNLEVLDENTIVQALRGRFQKDRFYTYISDILVAVNPCKPLPLFDQEHHHDYTNLTVRSERPPHLFWVADNAYRALRETGQNQVILVSGESGAGKTESTKYMIRHLMHISPSDDRSLLDKIVQVNPLLEAFGNAATLMNGNSSRFGKFIELSYSTNGALLGAKIDDYIVEKSRVVHRSMGEKNFHVFYALFAGMSHEKLLYYFLEDPDCHRIMRDADPDCGVFRDAEELAYYKAMYVDLIQIMSDVGFSDGYITLIFLILAAILHLANIVFVPIEETDGVSVVDEYPLHAVAKLLGIEDEVELTEALISTVSYIKGERIQAWKNLREANDSRDALAKELYARLFGWIVGQMNRNMWTHSKKSQTMTRGASIGILDMSGFENFGINGFDQFLINITNEKLQQYFMEYIFPQEKRDYESEGIQWTDLKYRSNEDVLDLIFQKPHGIMPLLDEESNFPQSSDATLVEKLKRYCSRNSRFMAARGNSVSFGIKHYAEEVTYNADGFLERNRDNMSQDLVDCLLRSNNDFIQALFKASRSPTGTISDYASNYSSRPQLPTAWPTAIDPQKLRESLSRKASLRIKRKRGLSGETVDHLTTSRPSPTVTRHFKKSLSNLMGKLTQASPLFVRCIKPNNNLSSGKFDSELVRRQLLCNGLMELAELRRDGYPFRIRFEDFAQRYGLLCDVDYCEQAEEKCMVILQNAGIQGYQIGKTKVFLKNSHKDIMESVLRVKIEEEHEKERRLREQQQRLEQQHLEDEQRRRSQQSLLSLESGDSDSSDGPMNSTPRHSAVSIDIGYTDTAALLQEKLVQLNDNGTGKLSGLDKRMKKAAPQPPSCGNLTDDGISLPSKVPMSEESKSTTTTSYESLETDNWRPYDIFQVSEREFEENDAIFKEILKVVRLVLYILLFVAVLGGAVANRLSLMLIISGINKESAQASSEHITTLLFCVCGPLCWSWLMSLMKILFGGKEWPSPKTVLVVLIVECLQTFGVALLIYRVLPSTDLFRGIVTTFAICQIPSLLKVIVHEKRPNPSISEILAIIMNIAAFIVQILAIPFFTVGDFVKEGNFSIVEGHETNGYTYTPVILKRTATWELPLGLLLTSLGWWENYVSGEWTIFGKITIPFKHMRKILQDSRETTFLLVGPFKIGLTILLARLLTGNSDFKVSSSPVSNLNAETPVEAHFVKYSLMYLQIGTGIILTYLAGLVCKLHMQKMAFSLPIVLAPPTALAVAYLQCRYQFLPANWHTGGWFCTNEGAEGLIMPLIAAAILLLSYCITVSHIWFPQSERMAKLEKLFITPHYDGVFPDFTLTLRRRRNDKEIKLTGFDTFRYVGEDSYSGDDPYISSNPNVIPQVYVCATMWHETRQEMTQLLKSLFRLDYGHCASRLAQDKFGIKDPDFYELEIHIIFDDAFDLDEKVDKYVPNSFVQQLCECMEDAARSVVKGPITLSPPKVLSTPYGGRLTWTMPGHTNLVVHVKDKNKIRHRKRWSQCLYLYYLLGYRLMGSKEADKMMADESEMESSFSKTRQRKKGKSKKDNLSRPIKSLFRRIDPEIYEMAENTFILTLDGDVDFKPESVKLLIDRMKKNRKVGAVCGRIHPIGSGPMVWYQQFEYAVGHWLQKAAEHVFGCVLCCPGCFSLFRGSALMDDNVMKMYTTKPTEARHYIQFEQGEDRWLCTLLLQQGHRIDYCAGADALTFAPETFNEFFNQRRRWSPSTLANMMDLLSSWYDTVRINDNISRPYILYQFILMASTILAPSTIILMITGSYHSVLNIGIWESYFLSLLPVVVYIGICMTMKSDHQITAAAILSAIYTVIMMIATVGTIISIVTENFGSPNVVFLTGLVTVFFISGILHPQEFFCLIYGLLYFLTVPSTFILLTVYYLCNLNNVSWGTREVPKKLTKEEEEVAKKTEEEKKKKRESKSILNRLGITNLVSDAREMIHSFMGIKKDAGKEFTSSAVQTDELVLPPEVKRPTTTDRQQSKSSRTVTLPPEDVTPPGWEPNPNKPYWFGMEYLNNGPKECLTEEENDFWKYIIKKYLHPIDEDKSHKEKIKNDLASLKNNVVFIYIMINFLWTVITLQLQAMEDELKDFYIIAKYEPLSLMFLSVFAFCISLQFLSMFIHRWGTFLHLMSSTHIDWFKNSSTEEDFVRFVVSEAQRLQRLEPAADYDEMPTDYDDNEYEDTGTANNDSEAYDILPTPPGSNHNTHRQRFPQRDKKNSPADNDMPLLQQIFEDRLEHIHRKLKHGTFAFRHQDGPFQRNDSKRYSNKISNMRQRMFKRSFKNRGHESQPDDPAEIKIEKI
ncbi:hypothetical protein ACJMK2_043545 [Sinanodonta woodiana]|uniref:chitin synthase n=1 Tax=Sinanodonta woodiana TaxID=1069815 RepID=A0ABD3VZ04_SINWO